MTEEGRAAYDLLRKYRHMIAREAELRERIARCNDAATRSTTQLDAVRGSGASDRSRLETAKINAMDLEQQLQHILSAQMSTRLKIQAAIDAIDCVELRRVIELRYIDGERWEAINARMHISTSTSKRWHNMGLEDFWAAYTATK